MIGVNLLPLLRVLITSTDSCWPRTKHQGTRGCFYSREGDVHQGMVLSVHVKQNSVHVKQSSVAHKHINKLHMQSVLGGETFVLNRTLTRVYLMYLVIELVIHYLLHDPFITLEIELLLYKLKFQFLLVTTLALLYLLYFKINQFS